MLNITKDQEIFISSIKKKIKAECKFIINSAGSKNIVLKNIMTEILENGCVSGSLLSNFYQEGKHSTSSDIDIFINYNESSFERFKKNFQLFLNDVEIESWNDKTYRTNSKESVKFTLGALNSIKINVLFVENLQDFSVLVSNFDFETSNWFYEYKTDSLFFTEECFNCLRNHELDYTYSYRNTIKNKIDMYNTSIELSENDFNMNAAKIDFKSEIFGSDINRLQNYINVKKYVLSESMKKTIEEINSKCTEIWKI